MGHILGGEITPIVMPSDTLAQLEIPNQSVIRNAPFGSQNRFIRAVIAIGVDHVFHGHPVIHYARTGHLAVQHRFQRWRVKYQDQPIGDQFSFLFGWSNGRPGGGL